MTLCIDSGLLNQNAISHRTKWNLMKVCESPDITERISPRFTGESVCMPKSKGSFHIVTG